MTRVPTLTTLRKLTTHELELLAMRIQHVNNERLETSAIIQATGILNHLRATQHEPPHITRARRDTLLNATTSRTRRTQ